MIAPNHPHITSCCLHPCHAVLTLPESKDGASGRGVATNFHMFHAKGRPSMLKYHVSLGRPKIVSFEWTGWRAAASGPSTQGAEQRWPTPGSPKQVKLPAPVGEDWRSGTHGWERHREKSMDGQKYHFHGSVLKSTGGHIHKCWKVTNVTAPLGERSAKSKSAPCTHGIKSSVQKKGKVVTLGDTFGSCHECHGITSPACLRTDLMAHVWYTTMYAHHLLSGLYEATSSHCKELFKGCLKGHFWNNCQDKRLRQWICIRPWGSCSNMGEFWVNVACL